jgi:hypothetical protein
MSMLTLKLPKELERELHRAAVTRGVSKSQLVVSEVFLSSPD